MFLNTGSAAVIGKGELARRFRMGDVDRHLAVVIYVLGLVGVVVGVDILFFRHNGWARLLANVGIVLLFAAFYLRFHSAFGGKAG